MKIAAVKRLFVTTFAQRFNLSEPSSLFSITQMQSTHRDSVAWKGI